MLNVVADSSSLPAIHSFVVSGSLNMFPKATSPFQFVPLYHSNRDCCDCMKHNLHGYKLMSGFAWFSNKSAYLPCLCLLNGVSVHIFYLFPFLLVPQLLSFPALPLASLGLQPTGCTNRAPV